MASTFVSDRLSVPHFSYAYVGLVHCIMVFLCIALVPDSSFVLLWIRLLLLGINGAYCVDLCS